MIRTILFDLDDTLYPYGSGIMDRIRELILLYVCTYLSLPVDQADALRREYFQTYGTTMRGLQVCHQIDPDDYLAFVHNSPLDQYLVPNPALDAALAAIAQQKVVFTNASREHAEAVLAILGVRRHFDRVLDIRDLDYESKPHTSAYRRVCDMLGVAPQECVLVEDNVRNLEPAKALGMVTVLVTADGNPAPDVVDYAIGCPEEIGRVLSQIEQADRS